MSEPYNSYPSANAFKCCGELREQVITAGTFDERKIYNLAQKQWREGRDYAFKEIQLKITSLPWLLSAIVELCIGKYLYNQIRQFEMRKQLEVESYNAPLTHI